MTMTEKQAREVAGLLDLLDDFEKLRKSLGKDGREFYICAQDTDECLHSDMRLPAASGLMFVEGMIKGVWEKLLGYGIVHNPAPE